MKSIIKINVNNTMECITINDNLNILNELLKKTTLKGTGSLKELYTWNKKIIAYGWNDGTNNKNKHRLPPCGVSKKYIELSEEIDLYGDIFIVCYKDKNIIDYSIPEYGELHYILSNTDLDNISTSDEENLDEDKKEQIEEDIDQYNLEKEKDKSMNDTQNMLLDEDLNEY